MDDAEMNAAPTAGLLDDELSDEDLEAVVGGLSRVYLLEDLPMVGDAEVRAAST